MGMSLERILLELVAEGFEDYVADECGDQGDGEVCGGEDVVEGECERLALPVGAGELTHQQVGIKEEDDECNLDHGSEGRDSTLPACGFCLHGVSE